MMAEQRRHAMSAFESREHAERTLDDLHGAGFKEDKIGWAMRHEETPEGATDVASGAAAGAVTGGLLGGLGAAAAMALIPGIGPFIAGGALATILTVGGASAAAGGLIGGLAGLGADEDEAKFYDEEFRAGRPVMTVDAGDRHDEANEILRRGGGYDYASRQTGGTGTTTTTTYTATTSGDSGDMDRPAETTHERTTTRTDR